jgi:hypothetical protein
MKLMGNRSIPIAGAESQVQVPRSAALDLFEEDSPEGDAPHAQPQMTATSRRKQVLLADKSKQQEDKYAEDKEVVIGELQELQDSNQLDVSGQVNRSASHLVP